jgi:hypothetical protein
MNQPLFLLGSSIAFHKLSKADRSVSDSKLSASKQTLLVLNRKSNVALSLNVCPEPSDSVQIVGDGEVDREEEKEERELEPDTEPEGERGWKEQDAKCWEGNNKCCACDDVLGGSAKVEHCLGYEVE